MSALTEAFARITADAIIGAALEMALILIALVVIFRVVADE
jgi:hypothetical protein